jgi:hypothetical protein
VTRYISIHTGSLNLLEPPGPVKAVMGLLYLFYCAMNQLPTFPCNRLGDGHETDFTLYSPVLTTYTTSLTFSNSTFGPHSVFMCFVWICIVTSVVNFEYVDTFTDFLGAESKTELNFSLSRTISPKSAMSIISGMCKPGL